jgi:CBS domain containing-hemolysin-like protein
MDNRLQLIVPALIMVVLAGLFEGAETGIYRLSRLRLRLAVEKNHWSAVLLERVMQDNVGLLLSLLVGTSLAHYIATSLITGIFLAAVASEHVAELYTMLAAAPLLFVFSELIPKNVFLFRADALTLFVAPVLYVSHKVFTWCGVVPLLKLTSQTFARLIGSPISTQTIMTSSQSHRIRALLRDTQEEGFLSRVQMEMLDRIANIPGLRLNAVMVPPDRVRSVDVRSDRAAMLNELGSHAFSRLLVWRDTPATIVGFVDIYEALGSPEPFENLERFVKPIRSLDADTPIIEAIDIMRREEHKIILVTRQRAKHDVPVGIVTMKDLVEELMGELTEW